MLGKLYSESSKEKENSVADKNTYSMPLKEFIAEHKNLIKVLRTGSKEQLSTEAEKQEEELEKCMESRGMKMPNDTDDTASGVEK